MLNYLQNGGKIMVIAGVVPEIHAREAVDERRLYFEKSLNEGFLPGKILELRILAVQ